jgi:aminopeptidase N
MRSIYALAALLTACAAASSAPRQPPPPSAAPPKAAAAPASRDDGRLPPGVRPTRYSLDLSVDPALDSFQGRVRIGVTIERPTRVIVLHARGTRILTAAISTARKKQWARAELRMAAHGRREPEELVLATDDELPVGSAEIDLQYEAPYGPNLEGLYRVGEGGKHYAFTQFEPNDARRAFPCFDEPGFKTPYSVTITTPSANLALSNMPLAKRQENLATGLTSYEFRTSPPLPSYLVAFAVGPFELAPGAQSPVPMRLVALPGKTKLGGLALESGKDLLALLADYFEIPYPYAKLDLVAVPEFGAGAMENAGLVTFREELLLLDPERASIDARRELAGVLAHELAHQWFGNLVTTAWWNDLWLNEGFATWMGEKIVARYRPSWRIDLDVVRDKQSVMRLDALESARKIRQPVRSSSEALEAFDGITYDKGASLLRTVEHWLGEAAFRQGVHHYLEAHRFGSATADDLFSALGAATGKDVGRVMSSFADQSGVPLLEVATECRKKGRAYRLTLRLGQREYRPLGETSKNSKRWAIPVCARWVDARGHAGHACTLLDGSSGSVEADVDSCPGHVLPNDGEDGYYRYLPAPGELVALAEDRALRLDDREKIGLIGNAWALVKSGDLAPGDFLRVCQALSDARSHVVWEEMAATLREYSRALVGDSSRAAFRRRMAKLFTPLARQLGMEPRANESDEDRLLRKTVLYAMADLASDDATRNEASKYAARWLEDPKSISADLAEIVLPLAARKGDDSLHAKYVARMRAAASPEERVLALSGLAGFDQEKLVEKTLALSLDEKTKVSDLRYLFRPFVERDATAIISYRWVRAHFDALKRRLPGFVVERITGVVAGLCDVGEADSAAGFFRPRLHETEGGDKFLDQAVETSKLCAALRAGQGQASERALGVAK